MKLILIRGLPGSGKSTLAQCLINAGFVDEHYEADQFFIDADGKYQYDSRKIPQAHSWCQEMTRRALQKEKNVVVSNTFVEHWQMKPYIEMAGGFKAELQIIECHADFGSVHDVPKESMWRFKKRWENLHAENHS